MKNKNASPRLFQKVDIQKVLGQNTIQDISDSDDDELWEHASQIEKKFLEEQRSQQQAPDSEVMTYTNFQGKKPIASTQMPKRTNFKEPVAPLLSQVSQMDSNKENNVSESQFQTKFLNNKCTALQRQVKRLTEQLRDKKMQSSQDVSKHCVEVDAMRDRLAQLEKENNDLRNNQFLGLSQQQPVNNNLQNEVDNLRQQIQNMIKKEENAVLRKSSSNIKQEKPKKEFLLKMPLLSFVDTPMLTFKDNPPKLFVPEFDKMKKLGDHLMELQYTIDTFIPLDASQKEDFDNCWLVFQQIFTIVRDICECIEEEELRSDNKIIKRENFRSRQAALLAHQINHDQQSLPPKHSMFKNFLVSKSEQQLLGLEKKQHASKIRLIGMMAVLARESFILSEMISNVDVSILYNFTNKETVPITLLGLFSVTIKKFIIPSRQFFEYRGIAHELANLGCSISKHYFKFKDNSVIDVTLAKFLNSILAITLNNAEILIKLTEFVINVSKFSKREGLFPKLCKNHPSAYTLNSKIYSLIQIPLNGCELQILFLLIVHAFPQYGKVPQHRLELLFKLTENLNILAHQFILNGSFMKCLLSEHKFNSPETCKCLYGLICSLVTLHTIVLDHCSVNFNKYKYQIKTAAISLVTSLSVLLRHARESKYFMDCKFILGKLSLIYNLLKHGDIYDESIGKRIKAYEFYFGNDNLQSKIILKKNLEKLNLEAKISEQKSNRGPNKNDTGKERPSKQINDLSLQMIENMNLVS